MKPIVSQEHIDTKSDYKETLLKFYNGVDKLVEFKSDEFEEKHKMNSPFNSTTVTPKNDSYWEWTYCYALK